VVLASVLPDEVNQGYQQFSNAIVAAIDGVRPHNFAHAVDLVENGRDAFVTLTLTDGNALVFDRAAAKAREAAILERYHVPFGRSQDLRGGGTAERCSRTATQVSGLETERKRCIDGRS
jgi:hypothetical protein